jgi:large subunit ribosomal protein L25
MQDTLSLHAKKRLETGRAAMKALRGQRQIPAIMYGHGIDAQSIVLQSIAFEKLYEQAGESSLIDLVIEGQEPLQVLIHDVQRDPLDHAISHVDFFHVRMDEKLRAEIQLVFEGEAPAVKELGGIFVRNTEAFEVECLPKDLISEIIVNISSLKTFDDSIRVKDVSVPAAIQVLNNPEDVVVLVSEPRSQEELESLNEAVVEDVSAVEVAEKEKKEEDAAAEATSESK